MSRVIFDRAGVFIKDNSTTYYMVSKVDGKGGVEPVINHAYKETDLMYMLKEAIKGKRVRVVVEVLEDGDIV